MVLSELRFSSFPDLLWSAAVVSFCYGIVTAYDQLSCNRNMFLPSEVRSYFGLLVLNFLFVLVSPSTICPIFVLSTSIFFFDSPVT